MLFPRFRTVIAVVIIAFSALSSAAATEPSVQQEECNYDRANPSIDHARAFFSRLEYQCALTELQDILSAESLESHLQAEAYRLLSVVHYWIGYDEDELTDVIREKVINAGKAAFKSQPEWTGEFDIDDEDYLVWMQEARGAAEEELARERLLQQQAEQARRDSIVLAEKRAADSLASITLSQQEQDVVPDSTGWETSVDDNHPVKAKADTARPTYKKSEAVGSGSLVKLFSETRKFLNGGMLHFGYQRISFDNENFQSNVDNDSIEYWGGVKLGYMAIYTPFMVNADFFYHPYRALFVDISATEEKSVTHLGGDITVALNLFPIVKYVVPFGGVGYQLSSMSVDNEESADYDSISRVNTSGLFWVAGIHFHIPSRGEDRDAFNRVIFGLEYQKSLRSDERVSNQWYFLIGFSNMLGKL